MINKPVFFRIPFTYVFNNAIYSYSHTKKQAHVGIIGIDILKIENPRGIFIITCQCYLVFFNLCWKGRGLKNPSFGINSGYINKCLQVKHKGITIYMYSELHIHVAEWYIWQSTCKKRRMYYHHLLIIVTLKYLTIWFQAKIIMNLCK